MASHVLSSLGMQLRITKRTNGNETVLHIDGQLAGEVVAELENECRSVEGLLALDVTNLLSADLNGRQSIKSLLEHGARLKGASPYVQLLLSTAAH